MSDFLARIKPKRSTVSGEKPSSLDLQVAELAVNTADGVLFTKHSDGSIKEISGSGGGGGGGSINAIEQIGNVQARQSVSPGVLSWDVKDDENVLGGWRYDDGAFQLSLNKEAKNGFDIRPSVVAMPTTGTIWVSFDNLDYTEIAYTNRAINADVVVVDLVVTAPDDGFPGEIYVAFDSPYADGASFNDDILLYSTTENAWIPTPIAVNLATDWDTEGEEGIGLQDGMSMIWDGENERWTQGFPVLSSGGGGGGGQSSTGGYSKMVGPQLFFSAAGVNPTDAGWNSLGRTGDDNAHSLTVPFALVGTEFLGKPMPATITFCTNGNIHWDESISGSNGGRGGDFLADSANRDFWLAFWSQDTSSQGVYDQWDGVVWTIRMEFAIPYNTGTGCPVEVQFSTNGSIRVSYGENVGSDIQLGITKQGIAQDGVRVIGGFGAASDARGGWSWAYSTGDGVGRGTQDLVDVQPVDPVAGQILTWDGEDNIYKPLDPSVASVNSKTGDVVLKIQDLDDYALGEGPSIARDYSFTNGGETGPTNGQMTFITINAEVLLNLIVLQPDANGWDPAGAFENGGQVWMGVDGATPQAYTIVDVIDLGFPDGTQIEVDEDLPAQPAEGTPVLIYNSDPDGTQQIPLSEGDVLRYDGTDFKAVPFKLESLGDVDTTSNPPTTGQTLVYNAADKEWRPGTVSGGGGASELDGLSDVDVSTAAPLEGQALVYDSTDQLWKPGTVSSDGDGGVTIVNGRPTINPLYKVSTTSFGGTPANPGEIAAYSPNGSDTIIRYWDLDAFGNDAGGIAGPTGTQIDVTLKINGATVNLLGATYSHVPQGGYHQWGVAGTGLFSVNDRVEFIAEQPPQQDGDIVKASGNSFVGLSGSILDLQDSARKPSSNSNPYRTNVGPGLGEPSAPGEFSIRRAVGGTTGVIRFWPEDAEGNTFDDSWVGPVGQPFKGCRIIGDGIFLDLAPGSGINVISQSGYLQFSSFPSANFTPEELQAWLAISESSELRIFPTPSVEEDAAPGDVLTCGADGIFRPAALVGRASGSLTATAESFETDDQEILTLGKAGTFLTVTTSHAAWVRFYSDAASRTADPRTDQTVAPDRGSGVLLELITTGAETYQITPAVNYFNLDATPAAILYARVTNLTEAAEDITVDVTGLVIEA